jgi:hypothetical protein
MLDKLRWKRRLSMTLHRTGHSTDAREFTQANLESPVVHAAGREDGGAFFVLANMRRFELAPADVQAMPMPKWGEVA